MGIISIIRAILWRLWPLLLFILVLWVAYWWFKKRSGKTDVIPPWETKLWLYTLGATAVILLLSVAFMVANFEENKDMKYVPAHIEDGQMIKGKMVPNEQTDQ